MIKSSRNTVTLYRAVGPGQLQCIADSGWKRFPPRLHWQRYFYPMLHESFAHRIASQWNVEQSGVGYVLKFKVKKDYLEPLPIYIIGGPEHKEYRITADQIDDLNANIVGQIEVLATYNKRREQVHGWRSAIAWA